MQNLEIVRWSYTSLLYDYPMLMGGQEFMTYGLVILKNYNMY